VDNETDVKGEESNEEEQKEAAQEKASRQVGPT
jgi:hypothetical protein